MTAQPPAVGTEEAPVARGPEDTSPAHPKRYVRWLVVAVLGYFTASFVLSSLRLLGFYYENWDMGIILQSLWSATHGSQPFFNSGAYETLGVPTFFQVHPSFMLYPLAAAYYFFPNAFFLLAIQSAVVALAAVPLYYLGQSITGSPRKALWVSVLYLAWAPTLSSNLYDYHLEMFLPISLFCMFYFWHARRYAWATALAVLAMLTLEIGPLFVFVTGLFFVWPEAISYARRFASRGWRWKGEAGTGSAGSPADHSPAVSTPTPAHRLPSMRYTLALMAVSVAIYLLLRMLQDPWVSFVLGPNVTPSGSLWGLSTSSLGLSIWDFGANFAMKITYWALILALVFFLPMLFPRCVLLALPWLAFTFLSPNGNYVDVGYQYGVVAAYPVFVGAVYGIDRLPVESLRRAFRGLFSPTRPITFQHSGLIYIPQVGAYVTVGLVTVLCINVALTPLNPLMQSPNGTSAPGYWLTYDPGPGYRSVQQVASLLPPEAPVLASTDLFIFVANDVHAYAMLWYEGNPSFLPFNASVLPPYVLVSAAEVSDVPTWLQDPMLGENSTYGMLAYVPTTPAGMVVLYELHYTGPAREIGPEAKVEATLFGSALNPTPAAQVVPSAASAFGEVVQSVPGSRGFVWAGPYQALPPGHYDVNVSLMAGPAWRLPAPAPGQPLFEVDTWGFAHDPLRFGFDLTSVELEGGGWHSLTFSFSLSTVVFDAAIRGDVLYPDLVYQVEFVQLWEAP